VLVDEYQDSNVAQYELLKQLTDEHTYLCVVGDDDQSIYRFRGAEVRNILTFSESFPRTTVIKLEQNYRSTGPILDVASAVVRHNAGRLGKTLWTERTGGMMPMIALLRDQDEEVEYCLDLIERRPKETAILYRTNAQSRLFETALLRAGIPYRIVGSLRFYEREEIKDALATLKLCANTRDEISFRRIINKPARGIGNKSIDEIAVRVTEAGGDMLVATEAAIGSLSKKAGASARRFLDVIGEARSSLGAGKLSEFTERLLHELGIWELHAENKDEITARSKVENMEEFVNAASLYPATEEGLAEFLELVELDRSREQEESEDADVTLITMHNTKGLEFERVVVTGLEEGLFPRGGDEDPDEIEEERRLFYVAVTRARDELYLTSCSRRRLHGRTLDFLPSRFLGEIPRELVETAGDRVAAAAPGATNEYPTGSAVYHDNYGSGVVTRSWHKGSELVVQVQFETGRVARFLPRYTPLERIAGDS
jgi:DNA helicase-2/ATP-dependent DNA helicase PcrA